MFVPKAGRQFAEAAIEQIGVFEHLVVEIILRFEAQRTRLDAHVDVLGDQDDGAFGVQALLVDDHGEDLVVGLGGGQTGRQIGRNRLRLQEQASARQLLRGAEKFDTVFDAIVVTADDVVENAGDLAGVARDFRKSLLVVVELFQRHDRQEDVVFFKAIDAGRIVQQDVGVENEELVQGRCFFCACSVLAGHEGEFSGEGSKGFNEVKDFLCVSRSLDAAPFTAQYALTVNDKGAALNAAHQFAIQFFLFDDSKLCTQGFIGIGNQLERQVLFGLEVFMRFDAVTRNPGDDATGLEKFFMQVTELLRFGGASGRAVLGVKIKDQGFAAHGSE